MYDKIFERRKYIKKFYSFFFFYLFFHKKLFLVVPRITATIFMQTEYTKMYKNGYTFIWCMCIL